MLHMVFRKWNILAYESGNFSNYVGPTATEQGIAPDANVAFAGVICCRVLRAGELGR